MGERIALIEVWVCFQSMIFKYRKNLEEHTHSTARAQLDVPGMIDRGLIEGDLPLALQPLKVQYPKQHYTVLLRGTVQMLLQPFDFPTL